MYNGNKIKDLLHEQSKSNKELLAYLGVECNSSITQLIKGNPTAQKLEKIADFFGIHIDELFIRDIEFKESEGLTEADKQLIDKIKLLQQLLDDKDKVISLLEDKVRYLSADKTRTNEK